MTTTPARWNEARRLFMELMDLADNAQHTLLRDRVSNARDYLKTIQQTTTQLDHLLNAPTPAIARNAPAAQTLLQPSSPSSS